MKKRIISLIMSLAVCTSSFAVCADINSSDIVSDTAYSEILTKVASQNEIKVFLNGNTITFDQLPVIVNGRTMVPMRAIFESLGAEVSWFPEEQAVLAVKDGLEVFLVIGYNSMLIGETEIQLDAAPFIENGRTLVPLRAISEALRAEVRWNSETREIDIYTDGYVPQPEENVPEQGNNQIQASSDSQPDESVQYPEVEVFNAVNEIRASYGLPALIWSNALSSVARAHSYDMAYQGFFDHNSLDGRTPSDRIKNAGISYRRMAENIAAGQDTAAAVVDAWMKSDGHRANMLDPELTHLGVGLAIADNSQYKFYWTQCFTGSATVTSIDNVSAMEHEVLELVNKERASYGLSPLNWSDSLASVARAHSYDMATRNFFDHTNPDGQSPFDRMKSCGIRYSVAAENIAVGQNSPAEVVKSWMNSDGHRANILNASLTDLGVGLYVSNTGYGYYWTQNFCTPI